MTQTQPMDDASWSSAGLAWREAVRQWQDWTAQTMAPIDVCVFDSDSFAARWSSHGVGQLRLLRLDAPAQRVVHCGNEAGAGRATPSIQLVYALSGALKTRMGGSSAPGTLDAGSATQIWLAVGDDTAHITGKYFLNSAEDRLEPAAADPGFQDELLALLARETGTALPA